MTDQLIPGRVCGVVCVWVGGGDYFSGSEYQGKNG